MKPTQHSDDLDLRACRIFLIGYRGAGKSSVARLLAARLGWQAADADEELERSSGNTIREIFETAGEPGFRNMESSVLASLAQRGGLVIATGGGVILRSENRSLIRRDALVVWLKAEASMLWTRISNDPSNHDRRPPLTSGGLSEVEQLLAEREPLYQSCADLVIETTDKTPEAVAEEIYQRVVLK